MEQGENKMQEGDDQSQVEEVTNGGMAAKAGYPRKLSITRGLGQVGFLFSLAYLLILFVMAMFSWHLLWAMTPNEFGDLMAGVFAPLAFMWLVLGFFQQGQELRNSGEALWLQMEELRNSVEQQRGLVEATRDLRELEASIHKANQEETARASAPLLSLRANGYQMNTNSFRNHTFLIQNDGPPCNALIVSSGEKGLSNIGKLDNGAHAQVRLKKEADFEGSVTVRAEYIDSRSMPGATEWTVEFLEGHVEDVRKELIERN